MAAITTFDGLLARISNEFDQTVIFYFDKADESISGLDNATGQAGSGRTAFLPAVPNPLPTGVTAYIPTEVTGFQAGSTLTCTLLLAELINLGSLDISGASGTFTDGSAMPTRAELGTSFQLAGAVLMEATAAISATPGTFTITYVDQDGNSGNTSAAMTPTASAGIYSAGFAKLAAGDWGVKDITAAARSSGTTPTGTIKFWGVIPISMFSTTLNGPALTDDLINSGMIRRLGAGATLGVFDVTNEATTLTTGYVRFVGDS